MSRAGREDDSHCEVLTEAGLPWAFAIVLSIVLGMGAALAIAYAARSVSVLQTWTYKPQKRQDGSAFALTYRLLLRSCKLMGAFLISPLPPFSLEP